MIWLALSVSCSVLIFIVFKKFKSYQIDNLQAIFVNYLIAFSIGQWQNDSLQSPLKVMDQAWFGSVVFLGFLFISLFRLMAWVSQNYGMATVSVAVKMAVIIPVSFGVIYFGESIGILKFIGILLALAAVYMTTWQPRRQKGSLAAFSYPLILFIGSGFLDVILKYNEAELVPKTDQAWFASSIFGMAALLGLILIIHQAIVHKAGFPIKSVIGGIILGIPNFGSIYFLLRALGMEGLESSSIFALNNVGIVLISALLGYFFFKEKLSRLNIAGISLSILAIVLIALALWCKQRCKAITIKPYKARENRFLKIEVQNLLVWPFL